MFAQQGTYNPRMTYYYTKLVDTPFARVVWMRDWDPRGRRPEVRYTGMAEPLEHGHALGPERTPDLMREWISRMARTYGIQGSAVLTETARVVRSEMD